MTDTSREAVDMTDDELLSEINRYDPYDVEFARRFRALVDKCAALEASNKRLARDVKGLLDQLAAMTEAKDDALTPYLAGVHDGKKQGRKEALEEAAKVAERRDMGDGVREDREARRVAKAIRALIESPPDAG